MYCYLELRVFRERMIQSEFSLSEFPKLPRILYLCTRHSHIRYLYNRICSKIKMKYNIIEYTYILYDFKFVHNESTV